MKKYHRVVVVSRDGKVLGEALENEIVDTVVYKGIYATMQNVLQRK